MSEFREIRPGRTHIPANPTVDEANTLKSRDNWSESVCLLNPTISHHIVSHISEGEISPSKRATALMRLHVPVDPCK